MSTRRGTLVRFVEGELLNRPEGSELTEEQDLLTSGIVDSLGVMSLILFIEGEFGVDVPPEDVTIENFQSIAAIDDYLGRRTE